MKINTIEEFLIAFPSNDEAITYIRSIKYPDLRKWIPDFEDADSKKVYGVHCPACGNTFGYILGDGLWIKCSNNNCYKKYSLKSDTVFNRHNINEKIILMIIFLQLSEPNISSLNLEAKIGITQRTAWFNQKTIKQVIKGISFKDDSISNRFETVVSEIFKIK